MGVEAGSRKTHQLGVVCLLVLKEHDMRLMIDWNYIMYVEEFGDVVESN